ncbi:hypothetical protein Taro_024296 [Colocasia esculenta]|uniref:Uncharacterized protein n=1 Tax=Colocasia esculenta TaxID=4460 RepID=A0A843V720_COLES|nr:hypothetical protein [Colocasia esculenta]
MSGGPSGFHNAPVTRTFVIGSAALTVLFGFQGRSSAIGLSYQDVFSKFHFWKLIASVLGFSSTPELVFGLYLLYYFRVFERQIGSNKYSNWIATLQLLSELAHPDPASVSNGQALGHPNLSYSIVFVLFSVIVSTLLEILALAYLKDPTLSILASGPYGMIFSSFVPFFFDIPVSSRFRIFGIWFSDKSFIYLAGLQVTFYPGILMLGASHHMPYCKCHLNVFLAASFVFLEKISSTWCMWCTCWFPISTQHIWHPEDKVSRSHIISLFTANIVLIGRYFTFDTRWKFYGKCPFTPRSPIRGMFSYLGRLVMS